MAENDSKWIEWLKMAKHLQKWSEMSENGWKWLEIA